MFALTKIVQMYELVSFNSYIMSPIIIQLKKLKFKIMHFLSYYYIHYITSIIFLSFSRSCLALTQLDQKLVLKQYYVVIRMQVKRLMLCSCHHIIIICLYHFYHVSVILSIMSCADIKLGKKLVLSVLCRIKNATKVAKSLMLCCFCRS